MTSFVPDLLTWFGGALYVLIALAVVYLYFYKLAPTIVGSIKDWTVFSVLRVTVVLALIAILLGSVAVFTADWIFSQVLDTLPQTRIATEINRVTGTFVPLSLNDPGLNVVVNPAASLEEGTLPGATSSGATVGTPGLAAGSTVINPNALASSAATTIELKPDAMQRWAATVLEKYNKTNNYRDNRSVMSKRDLPEGVVCDVAAVSGGWLSKRNEQWGLKCSNDGFRSSIPIEVNGTAARGLTGGNYYSAETPFTIYGSGNWPESAYDVVVVPTPVPPPTPAAPQQGPSSSGNGNSPSGASPAPTAAPASSASIQTGGATARAGTGSSGEHTVQRGDNLAVIANRYGTTIRDIVNANTSKYPALQNNPNNIVVGWTLAIPQ